MVGARLSQGKKERRAGRKVLPAVEDRGLFKRDIVQMEAQLTPVMHHNHRHDLIIVGFTTGGQQFEVVIAGRRSVMAAPLVAHLVALKDRAIKAAGGRSLAADDMYGLRARVMVEGAWRTRVWVDQSGWQSRMHQFIAARWRIGAADNGSQTFGISPQLE